MSEPISKEPTSPRAGSDRPGRVLQFPTDRSLGTLRARPWNGRDDLPDPAHDPGYEPLAEAQGPVQVPDGVAARLDIDAPCGLAADLAPLAELPRDAFVGAGGGGSDIDDVGLAQIAHLTDLRGLSLALARGVTDAGLANLARLHKLRYLTLDDLPGIGDTGLAYLAELTALEDLSLYQAAVTDAGAAHLAGLTGLRHLSLAGTAITDDGLRHFARLTRLRDLDVHHSGVTDAGLAILAGSTVARTAPPRTQSVQGHRQAQCARTTGISHARQRDAQPNRSESGCEVSQSPPHGLRRAGSGATVTPLTDSPGVVATWLLR